MIPLEWGKHVGGQVLTIIPSKVEMENPSFTEHVRALYKNKHENCLIRRHLGLVVASHPCERIPFVVVT